jgi:hypothetical protein
MDLAVALRTCSAGASSLDGVDHFLREDITQNSADYNESLPFSAQLRAPRRRRSSPATSEREHVSGV